MRVAKPKKSNGTASGKNLAMIKAEGIHGCLQKKKFMEGKAKKSNGSKIEKADVILINDQMEKGAWLLHRLFNEKDPFEVLSEILDAIGKQHWEKVVEMRMKMACAIMGIDLGDEIGEIHDTRKCEDPAHSEMRTKCDGGIFKKCVVKKTVIENDQIAYTCIHIACGKIYCKGCFLMIC